MHKKSNESQQRHNRNSHFKPNHLVMTDMKKICAPCLISVCRKRNPMQMVRKGEEKTSNNASTVCTAHQWSHEASRKSLSYWRVKIIQKSKKKINEMSAVWKLILCDLDSKLFKKRMKHSCRDFFHPLFILFFSFISDSFSIYILAAIRRCCVHF